MFDLDVIVPFCSRFSQRIDDFKRYGLVNQGKRKVRVSIIVSGESIENLDKGWSGDYDIRVIENESPDYVANMYGFYLAIDPGKQDSKWLVRLDDDSCTDVDGLVSNLDKFYGHEEAFYLGDLQPLQAALNGFEGSLYQQYKFLLGDYEPFGNLLMNEVECGVMNSTAVSKVLSNPSSRRLLEKRASLQGGYGDCVVALASYLAGVRPVSCPFITHRPLVQDFSLLGRGVRNHIHMIARRPDGENFWNRTSIEVFTLITKVVKGVPSDSEKALVGSRVLVEGDEYIRVFELQDSYWARLKLDNRRFNWYESNGELIILDGDSVFERMKLLEDGSLFKDGASALRL
jgi:hypothetical protein